MVIRNHTKEVQETVVEKANRTISVLVGIMLIRKAHMSIEIVGAINLITLIKMVNDLQKGSF